MTVEHDARNGDAADKGDRPARQNPASFRRHAAVEQQGERAIDCRAHRGMAAGIGDFRVKEGPSAGLQGKLHQPDGNTAACQRNGKPDGRAPPSGKEQEGDG